MYDIAILGNAVVDGFARVEDAILTKYNMTKGDTTQFDHATFMLFNEDVMIEQFNAGGAAANTGWTLAKLGHKVAFLGRVGDDPAGRHFYEEMIASGASMEEPDASVRTFQIFVLNTPDGERTFAQAQTTAHITPDFLDVDTLRQSKRLLIEGFTLLDQMDGVRRAIQVAKAQGIEVILSLAAPFFIERAAMNFVDVVGSGVDLIIGNKKEFETLQKHMPQAAAVKMMQKAYVMTYSGEGAGCRTTTGEEHFAPCQKIDKPVDTTGAGDAFAAGYLSGVIQKLPAETALTMGHQLASKVIMQVGGRLKNVSAEMVRAA
ncbi:MAG: adenosine kinase [Alphaproteobacteria bacterium]